MARSSVSSENRFERHSKLTLLIVVAVLYLIIDVSAGRLANSRETRTVLHGLRNERRYRVPNEVYHHDLRPSVTFDSAFWGTTFYPIRTSSFGFKDATARSLPMRDSMPRVLFLGDSFTEGLGVPYDESFVGRIDHQARKENVDVLNGAVASYSPLIYWRKTVDLIERRGLEVAEVVVFLDISDIQDEASYFVDSTGQVRSTMAVGFIGPVPSADELAGLTPTSTTADRVRGFLRRNTFLTYRILSSIKRAVRPPAPLLPSCDPPLTMDHWSCRPGWTSSERIRELYGRTGLRRGSEHMTALAHFLAARGIPLTLVVYPWPQQLQWNDRRSLQLSFWRSWAAGENVRFVELFSDMFVQVDSAGLDRTIDRNFIPGDVHWNAAGHALVASLFLQRYCQASPARAARRTPLEMAACTDESAAAPPGPALPPTHAPQ